MVFLAVSMLPGITAMPEAAYQTIYNNFYWYDQTGASINTQCGCLRKFNDLYYWYGIGGPGAYDQACYTSIDLIHWTNKGIVLHTAVDANRMDVLYCDSTKQYVMFLKYNGNAAYLGIATASAPDGQFTFKSQTLVDNAQIGDMSMFKDTDGKAYLAFVWDSTGPNRQHGIYRMSPDYLTLDKRMYLWDIHSREAPHIFKRNNTYYYGVSETNGIKPSPTRYYTATNLAGPWSAATILNTPGSSTSYETQCDFVFPFEGPKDTFYMYVGDRLTKTPWAQGNFLWLPLVFNGAALTMDYYENWDIDISAGTWRPFDYGSNFALHKTATASSVSGANSASNVTDSTTYMTYINSRWESAASDPQWIMVDLGVQRDINRVILKWHSNYAKAFQIQVSNDATAWTDVYSTTKGASWSVTDATFSRTSARYVRMYGTQRGTQNGYSLFDFMVLNDSSATPATFKTEKAPIPSGLSMICHNNTVHYSIPLSASTKLEAFDAMGKLAAVLVDGFQNAGSHDIPLSGKVGRGLYVVRLTSGGQRIVSMQVRL